MTLVVLPPAGAAENHLRIENGRAHTVALEPTALLQSLGQELAVYGFSLEMVDTISSDLMAMFVKLMETSETENLQKAGRANWFQGLLPGDLIVLLRSGEVSEERIVSLQKSFWRSRAEIVLSIQKMI